MVAGRTFAIGDIHGDLDDLFRLLSSLPELTAFDSLVFLGDYIDSGPSSADIIDFLRVFPAQTAAKIITLRGNHEDAWLRVIDRGWPEFVLPVRNGCLATARSFLGKPPPAPDEEPTADDLKAMLDGSFFPPEVVAWMRNLPYYHEDEHAIYVHAGLTKAPSGGFQHPADVKLKISLLWCRDQEFFRGYRGKLIVFGHTATKYLPPELSAYTPEDPKDLWAGPCAVGLDTLCGKGGFLTALELPSRRIFESR